ncbi:hypothetical protein HBO04_18800 [Pseudomonas proteolytica]|uniref:hypothetical protein n=1 Tax=Pseudomonas proteolytica TaxID=219574 RepID=UPI00147433A5|nr:hypothetical protein [Pseudomonas proteolytica]NMZ02173.1 hypothetical protein [Pseudomonas proteolytica]
MKPTTNAGCSANAYGHYPCTVLNRSPLPPFNHFKPLKMAKKLKKISVPHTKQPKKALIVAINEHVDEDVTLVIDGITVNCFISVCPYEISIGNTYDIELTLTLAENYTVQSVTSIDRLVEKKGNGYAYFLYGKLCNDAFNTFTILHSEEIHYEHPELNDQLIKLEVLRIDVTFL